MEKKKVSYRMNVNNFVSENEAEYSGIYSYGSVQGIKIRLMENSATIEFVTGTRHTHEELIEKFSNFSYLTDAIRKIYITHALKYNKGLSVEKIILSIGDKEAEINKNTQNAKDFPFVYSMIESFDPDGTLWLDSSKWQDEKILNLFLTRSKSKIEEDYGGVVSGLYSFILAAGKKYEIEKFTNLWTAFNAYYNYHCKDIRTEKGKELCERSKLSTLLKDLKYGERIANKNYYDGKNGFKKEYQQIRYCAANITASEIEELYNVLLANAENPNIALPDTGIYLAILRLTKSLKNASKTNPNRQEDIIISPFGLLLFDYAYNLRCKYLHGNKPTLLFSSGKSGEISLLRIINYFLCRFLKEHIADKLIMAIEEKETK